MKVSDLSVDELRAIIREEIDRALDEKSKQKQPQYLSTTKAAEVLGYSRRQLLHAVNSGLLRRGIEVQDRSPNGEKPSYYFDLEACKRRLQTVPEKRSYRV